MPRVDNPSAALYKQNPSIRISILDPAVSTSRFSKTYTEDELQLMSIAYGMGDGNAVAKVSGTKPFLSSLGCAENTVGPGKYIVIEAGYITSGTNPRWQTIFVGELASIARDYTDEGNVAEGEYYTGNNAVQYEFYDWLPALAYPVRGYLGFNRTIGAALAYLNNQEYLWPKAGNTRVIDIDKALFKENRGHNAIAEGQPLGTVIKNILKSMHGHIIDMEYRKNTAFITARKFGDVNIDLVVGNTDKAPTICRATPMVSSITGDTIYSSVYTRITGIGDLNIEAIARPLIKTWSGADETACLANPSLLNNPRYRHVGRLFAIENDSAFLNTIGAPIAGYITDVNKMSDQAIFLVKAPAENDYRRSFSGARARMYRTGLTRAAIPLEITKIVGFTGGKFSFIEFDQALYEEYYTDAQKLQMEAGVAVIPTKVFLDVMVQSIEYGNQLSYDTGYRSDLPIRRHRIYANPQLRKVTFSNLYDIDQNDLAFVDSTHTGTIDMLPILVSEVNRLHEVSSVPEHVYTVHLWYMDIAIKRGYTFNRILDRDGQVLYDNLGWHILGKTLDVIGKSTYVYVSSKGVPVNIPGVMLV